MSMTAEPIDATDRYVGDRLSVLRKDMGLNLAELERTSAISIAELSAIEAGSEEARPESIAGARRIFHLYAACRQEDRLLIDRRQQAAAIAQRQAGRMCPPC